ncbi:MBL fold metallo-hydrolase [Lachnospiraceae bacterium ZAX-1]
MRLTVLGSSSSGNCYLIHNDNECLVLDAGIPFKDVVRTLNYKTKHIMGLLVTHEHKDHAKYIADYINAGIPVYTSRGTAGMISDSFCFEHVKDLEQFEIGNFTVSAFSTVHDAKEPLGFLIQHEEMGSLLFATDTAYIEYTFEDVNHFLIECNYSQEIIDKNCIDGKIPTVLRGRIMRSHMELKNCIKFLNASDAKRSRNIILCHLSDANSDEKMFCREVENKTGKTPVITESGLEINLNIDPF